MTENKRFTLVKCYNEQWGIVDKSLEEIDQLVLITTSKSGTGYLVGELNKLNEENEQLKQFKEDVFNKIDMHLRMLPTARDNEFNEDDGDPSLYTGAIYMLETLKKELME